MRMRNFISRLLVTAMFPFAAALTSAGEPTYSYFGNDGDQGLVRATSPIHRIGFENGENGRSSSDLLKKPCGVGCGCCPSHTFIAGAEATLLWADLKGTRGAVTVDALSMDPVVYSTDLSDPEGMFAAPRVWFGWQGPRWGVVTRYWDLRGDARFSQAFDGVEVEENEEVVIEVLQPGILSESDLRAYNVDLELTRALGLGNWAATASGGVRHAHLGHGTQISVVDGIDGDLMLASADARSRFSGTGLTTGLLAHRPLWADSNWSAFWNTRASLVWGSHRTSADSLAISADEFAIAPHATIRDSSADMFIGEIQVGLQWEQQLRYVPGTAFFRVAGEYQYWDVNSDAGVASATTAGVFNEIESASITASADAGSPRLHLYGLTLGTGFLW